MVVVTAGRVGKGWEERAKTTYFFFIAFGVLAQ